MDSPLVSVVMIVYNQKDTFCRAIDSVLAQKCDFPFEILIGDDASTDGTAEIVKEYAKKNANIKVFCRTQNLGVTRNAYELIKVAEGKYIASCEGDDFWCDENKLQKQIDFLESHLDYVGCSHNVNIVNEKGEIYSKRQPDWVSKKRDYSAVDFKGIYLPGQSGSIVKRNVFKDSDCSIIYSASDKIGDRTTIMLCLPHGKFYHFDEYMSCYTYSFGHEKRSVTDNNYANNSKAFRDEWNYTLCLEKYARTNFNAPLSFEHYKHSLFFSSVIANIKGGDKRDKTLPSEILHSTSKKTEYIFALIPWFVIKFLRKIRRRKLKHLYERGI